MSNTLVPQGARLPGLNSLWIIVGPQGSGTGSRQAALWSREDAATTSPHANPTSDTCLTWAFGVSFLEVTPRVSGIWGHARNKTHLPHS